MDPIRAARILGLEQGAAFSPKVLYVYEKQLEEADIIVINKSDLLDAAIERAALERALGDTLSAGRGRRRVSARTGASLDDWFDRLLGADAGRVRRLDVDYEVYAEGEALLGWLQRHLSRSRRPAAVRRQSVPRSSWRTHMQDAAGSKRASRSPT